MYLSVTNQLNSVSRVALRGPAFRMPADSAFEMLDDGAEPNEHMIHEAVEKAFEDSRIVVGSMESEPITFAGYGEPLLRADVISKAARLIKDTRHGATLRIKTNGLIKRDISGDMIKELKSAGIDKISISLSMQYNEANKMYPSD